ncbi:MAG: VOC family protein [Planctomycetota bacterium]
MAARIRFLHRLCHDLDAIRAFYGEGMGFEELSYRNDEEHGWVVFASDGLQFMFHRWPEPLPPVAGFAWQPGDGEGTEPRTSIGVHVPEEDWSATVERLRALDADALTPEPTFRQEAYWGWTLRDPAGETVEIWYEPAAG